MNEMINAYQEINKRRKSNDMHVNSLTMFAEAWNHLTGLAWQNGILLTMLEMKKLTSMRK